MGSGRPIGAMIVVVLALAGCQIAEPTEPPFLGRSFIVGCTNVDVEACDRILNAVLGDVPPDRTGVVAVEIELYGCFEAGSDTPASCPPSLEGRTGISTIDFNDGAIPLQFSIAFSTTAPTIEPVTLCPFGDPTSEACWRLSEPQSDMVSGSGPFPYRLGHCGLGHIVDFDNSFWVVSGSVTGEPRGMMGGVDPVGTIELLGRNLAEYAEPGVDDADRFVARLARYPDLKYIWQWCA